MITSTGHRSSVTCDVTLRLLSSNMKIKYQFNKGFYGIPEHS